MNKQITEEFKIQAVKQVTDHGHSVSSAANPLELVQNEALVTITCSPT